jgi:hypothetical protein
MPVAIAASDDACAAVPVDMAALADAWAAVPVAMAALADAWAAVPVAMAESADACAAIPVAMAAAPSDQGDVDAETTGMAEKSVVCQALVPRSTKFVTDAPTAIQFVQVDPESRLSSIT